MSPRSPRTKTVLERLLKEASLTGPHLEIGTDRAKTLAFMMRCYSEQTRPKFVAIDTFDYFPNQRNCVGETLRQAGINPASVEFRKGSSWSQLPAALARPERYSFILIDAGHTVRNVIQDLRWTRMLEPGGYVCVHDYKARFPGVMWAVDWFLFRNRNYKQIDLAGSLIILQKIAAGRPEISDLDLVMASTLQPIARVVLRFTLNKQKCGQRRKSRFDDASDALNGHGPSLVTAQLVLTRNARTAEAFDEVSTAPTEREQKGKLA